MISKKITYTDYNGNERTEEFFFNLTKPELIELQLSADGGLEKKLEKIIAAQDIRQVIDIFKKIILMSYGVPSDDGKRFIKSKELSEEFSQTEAYSELFMELSQDADAASKFINGIVPSSISSELQKAGNNNNVVAIPENK